MNALAVRIAKLFLATLLLAILFIVSSRATCQEARPLLLETHISLPNVKGRIDHLSVDVKGQRLFVAAVDNHTLEVVDLKSAQRVRTIADLAEPQGVFYDASTNRLFVACGLDGVTKIYDGTTFQSLASVKFPDDADNIRYDTRSKGVIVGYAGAKALRKKETGTGGLGFIDSTAGKQNRDIVIDAHPESFRLEEKGTRLFVNVPDKKEIEVVDVEKGTILARWPVSAKNNFPMSLDEAHHRLFVGAWTPPRLIVFDTETGKEVASLELGEKGIVNKDIGGVTDDLFYDSARSRVYVLNALGSIDVFQQKDPDHYDLITSISMPPHTQTGLFVPEWGKLFAAVQKQGEQSAEIRVYRAH